MLRPGIRSIFRLAIRRGSLAAEEMREQIELHLALRVEQLMARGMSRAEAEAEARRRFGPAEEESVIIAAARRKEHTVRRRETLSQWWRQVIYGVRLIGRYPSYALATIGTLALGIGSSTAIFGLVKNVLLDPLPFREPNRLVFLAEQTDKGEPMLVSFPNFADWRSRAQSFVGLAAISAPIESPILGLPTARRLPVQLSSGRLFETLGVTPVLGRLWSPDETKAGAALAVLVSERFWRAELGAPSSLQGVTIGVFNQSAPIIGVIPNEFRLFGQADVWYPTETAPNELRGAGNFWVVGRLAAGRELAAARAELTGIAQSLKREYGDATLSKAVYLEPLKDRIVGSAERPLLVLLGAAAFMFLATCSNVMLTGLARGVVRHREMAVRAALGAGRADLKIQMVAETLVLAAIGVGAGLWLAAGGLALARQLGPGVMPRLDEARLDLGVVSFAVSIAVASALGIALIPSASGRSSGLFETLRGQPPRPRSLGALVIAQVAAATLLLAGAGLFIRSLTRIISTDVGYDPDDVGVVSLSFPDNRYPSPASRVQFLDRAIGSVAAIPGVDRVAAINVLPLDPTNHRGPVLVPPFSNPGAQDQWRALAGFRVVSPDYFKALEIPLVQGRLVGREDQPGMPGAVVINRSLAEKLWPGQDPIGKQVRALWDFTGEMLTVVGVVGNARDWRSAGGPQHEMYLSMWQRPEHTFTMNLVVSGPGNPRTLAALAEQRLKQLDPELALVVTTLPDAISATVRDRWLITATMLAFALAVLGLTATAVFGTVAFLVERRTREMGIRAAIGAAPATLWRLVQRDTLKSVGIGVLLGTVATWSLAQVAGGLLYQIKPRDPIAIVGAMLAALAVAAIATAWPARRVTRIDPTTALRAE